MPFNFTTMKHYKIDYNKLFNETNSQEILDDKFLQGQLISAWMSILKNEDDVLTKQLSSKKSMDEIRSLMIKEPEMFQLPMHHKENDIYLHFRIHALNNWINDDKDQSTDADLSEFTAGNINWFPVNLYKGYRPNFDNPIVMIPFHNNQHHFLVIDGNHRLTYCTKNNIKKIKAICLAEQSIAESYMFASGFDKFYYIFMNEMNHMANATHYEKQSAPTLINKSFLKNGKIMFNRI